MITEIKIKLQTSNYIVNAPGSTRRLHCTFQKIISLSFFFRIFVIKSLILLGIQPPTLSIFNTTYSLVTVPWTRKVILEPSRDMTVYCVGISQLYADAVETMERMEFNYRILCLLPSHHPYIQPVTNDDCHVYIE